MRILSTAGATARHGLGAFTEAGLVAAIAVTLVLGVAVVGRSDPAGAADVYAAKGGGGGQAAVPSIALAQVSERAASIQPSLGSTISFDTAYPKTVKNPRIEVLCYQGGSLVYGEAGGVNDSFLLGGGWSLWLEGGGGADCTANLFYFGYHAGQQTYDWLASTSFAAGG